MTQILCSFLLLSSVSQAQSIQSGMWQVESSIEINGISLPKSVEKECISENEAKDIKKTITKELEKNGCSSTKWKIKGKQVEISLKCAKSDLEAEGDLRGTVSLKDYNLSGEAEGNYKGIPSQANIVLKGKWLKNCGK